MRIVLAGLSFLALSAIADAAEIPASSKVESVTVFLSGAEVVRTAKVQLEKGEHTIVINDVPAGAIAGSIRVEGKATGKLSIGSVDTSRKFLQRSESLAADGERKSIEDRIEQLRDERSVIEAESQAAETQKALIANLAQLPTRPAPSGNAPMAEDWPRILSIISENSMAANRVYLGAQQRLRDVDRRIEDLEKNLAALAPPTKEQTEVRIHVDAESPLDADIAVHYQVPNASWAPIYDARLDTGTKTKPPKLEIARRATIMQRSGENWNDVKLQLSTARPSEGAAMPPLNTQIVDFEPEIRPMAEPAPTAAYEQLRTQRRKAERESASDAEEVAAVAAQAAPPPPVEPMTETFAKVNAAPFEATFQVPGRASVKATGEVKRVVLMTEEIEPVLSSRAVPKLVSNAYLYAAIKLPKGTPLLKGRVYLFRDGTFVGTGELPLLQSGEIHQLGFGIDDLVKVRHAVLEEKRGETGLISTSHVDSRNFRVTIKNLHERPIDVSVIDRVPVSQNQEIKIDYTGKTAPTAQNIEDKRGVMSFDTKLEPDEEKVLEYGYRISWPATKSIMYGP